MRQIQTWLALGLVAVVPGVTLAGSLNSPQLKSSRAIRLLMICSGGSELRIRHIKDASAEALLLVIMAFGADVQRDLGVGRPPTQ